MSQDLTYEQALDKLDATLKRLEDGDLSLDDALTAVDEARIYLKVCTDPLGGGWRVRRTAAHPIRRCLSPASLWSSCDPLALRRLPYEAALFVRAERFSWWRRCSGTASRRCRGPLPYAYVGWRSTSRQAWSGFPAAFPNRFPSGRPVIGLAPHITCSALRFGRGA